MQLGIVKKLYQPVHIIGWGSVNPNNSQTISNELRVAEMKALYYRNCKRQMSNKYKTIIYSTNVCTSGIAGRGDCQGDSGGPLLDESDFQVGIVSWGLSCANKLPNIYTRVASYISWLKYKTKLDLKIKIQTWT